VPQVPEERGGYSIVSWLLGWLYLLKKLLLLL